jgi:hypothetical protein
VNWLRLSRAKLVQVRARVREAQETASAKVRTENAKLVKVRVASLNGLFSQAEPLVSDAPSCELPASPNLTRNRADRGLHANRLAGIFSVQSQRVLEQRIPGPRYVANWSALSSLASSDPSKRKNPCCTGVLSNLTTPSRQVR